MLSFLRAVEEKYVLGIKEYGRRMPGWINCLFGHYNQSKGIYYCGT